MTNYAAKRKVTESQGTASYRPIPDLPGRIPEQFSQLTIVEHYSDIQKISLNFREVLKVAV